MKKIEWSLPINAKWGSLVSKYSPETAFVSPDSFTSGSTDFITHLTGNIEKRWTDVLYNSTPLIGPLADQYEMIFQSGERHLLFRDDTTLKSTPGDTIVTDVFAPLNSAGSLEYFNYLNVCYLDNGIDAPLAYDLTGSYGGVSYLPADVSILDYAALTGAEVIIDGTTLTEGVEWTAATDNDTTAASLASAIDAIGGAPYDTLTVDNVITVSNASPTYAVAIDSDALAADLSIAASTAPRIRPMGVTPPGSAVTFAADTAGGSVPGGAHTYVVTFLYMGFQESNAGDSSAVHTVVPADQTVNITAVPVGDYGVTARNIYRDDNDGVYLLIGTINDNTTTTFTDTFAAGTTPLVTTNGLPPTFGLSTLFLSRAFVAKVPGSPSTLYWSNPGQVDSWNPSNFILCNPEDSIQALVVYQGILYVFNKYSFGSITGNSDNTFAYAPVSASQVGCVDNRSIQIRAIDGYPVLVFLSSKGFYAFNGSSLQYISDPIEDIVNLNITQGSSSQGSNSQSTLSDWSSGTATPGIDFSTGVITLQPAIASYSGNSNWNAAIPANAVTQNVSGRLSVPLAFSPTAASGIVVGNTQATSAGLPTALTGNQAFWLDGNNTNIGATKTSGTITRNWFLIDDFADNELTSNPAWINNGCTVSGNAIHAGSGVSSGSGAAVALATTGTGSWSFRAEFGTGTKYVRFMDTIPDTAPNFASGQGYAILYSSTFGFSLTRFSGFSEATIISLPFAGGFHDYRITRTAAGLFTVYIDGVSVGTGTDNTYTSSSYFVVGNNGPSGSDVAVTNIYYSQQVWTSTTGTAETNSQAVAIVDIDQLTTPTAEGAISGTFTTPAGTSVTIETATSPDDITYTSFAAVGVGNAIASPADRYLRIRFTLACPIDSGSANADLTTPSVADLAVSWTPGQFIYNTVNEITAPSTGTWTSAIYDSECNGNLANAITVALTGVYAANTSATVLVEGATDAFMASVVSTTTINSPTTTSSVNAPTTARYWRITYTLDSSDGIYSPLLTPPTLLFSNVATWTSNTIDCTTDVTTYNAFSVVQTVPVGTTTLYEIATSADDISYTSYSSVALAPVQRYVKVRATLTANAGDTISPSTTQIQFTWNLNSTFTSSTINTGVVPSGFGIFQTVQATHGGTLSFAMRSASSAGGLPAAAYVNVLPGNIPVISPLQFVQWRVILTGSSSTSPEVESVTVNWNIGTNVAPVRVASMFFDKTYYLSAAEAGQTTNNIVIAYDYLGNWRVFQNINMTSMGLFFQLPYYLDGVRNNIYQWQVSLDGTGSLPFMMDVRTKAFNLSDVSNLKNVRSLWVNGLNTGTTIHAYYSLDRGQTWIEMLNSLTGTTGYTSTVDDNIFNAFFVPDYALGQSVEAVEVMFRVTSSDAFPCQIVFMRPTVYQRSGRYLGVPL